MNSNQEQGGDSPQTDDEYDAPTLETSAGRSTIKRAVAASAMGNATEWFDYGVYSVAVVYITANFFSGATVWALATFAISFMVRPLGGLIWGPLGDRLGRKAVLAITILMMAGSTAVIGLLPTEATIGQWAPALLVLMRLIQGFSTGGEYGGAATFMAEYSPDNKRGFLGSFLEFGTLLGYAMGALVVLGLSLLIGEDAMMAWGWRIPFLLAAPMGIIGMYLRTKMEDTPVFREMEDETKAAEKTKAVTEVRNLLVRYWKPLLTMAGLVIALNIGNYTLMGYMPTYLETQVGLSTDGSLTLIAAGEIFMMLLIPFFGRLSDRIGRKPMWLMSLLGLFVAAIPMYLLIGTGFSGALIGFAVLGVFYVMQLSTISATFPAMFPTQVRYAGFAITYNLATAIFGGTAPMVNEALIEATGSLLIPAFYMMAACVVGLISLKFVIETAGASIRGTEIPSCEDEAATATR